MSVKKPGLQGTETQAKIRTLLALWDLGGVKEEVKKSDLTKRVQRSNEKAGDYQSTFDRLEKAGAIASMTKSRVVRFSLTDEGVRMLHEGLKSFDFEYEAGVGAKTVNALLKWIRQMDGAVSVPTAKTAKLKLAIASYEEFKQAVLEAYDHLNWNYNLNDLVPIYRIRREIGDRVSRPQFNEWLLEMQANDLVQLQGGSLPDSDPAKIEDSITTEVSGLRCYAKRLIS